MSAWNFWPPELSDVITYSIPASLWPAACTFLAPVSTGHDTFVLGKSGESRRVWDQHNLTDA